LTGWARVTFGIAVVLLLAVTAGSWILPAGPVSAQGGHEAPRLAQTTPEPTKPTARPRPVTVIVITKPVTVVVVTKIVVTEGAVTPTPTAAPMLPDQPPVVPEASTTVLVLAAAGSLAGYVALQWRARRR
jgi:hypothetical protein